MDSLGTLVRKDLEAKDRRIDALEAELEKKIAKLEDDLFRVKGARNEAIAELDKAKEELACRDPNRYVTLASNRAVAEVERLRSKLDDACSKRNLLLDELNQALIERDKAREELKKCYADIESMGSMQERIEQLENRLLKLSEENADLRVTITLLSKGD